MHLPSCCVTVVPVRETRAPTSPQSLKAEVAGCRLRPQRVRPVSRSSTRGATRVRPPHTVLKEDVAHIISRRRRSDCRSAQRDRADLHGYWRGYVVSLC
jgi:hypothetical protein